MTDGESEFGVRFGLALKLDVLKREHIWFWPLQVIEKTVFGGLRVNEGCEYESVIRFGIAPKLDVLKIENLRFSPLRVL